MKKSEALAKKIRDMGGVCVFYPTPRHTVLVEDSGEAVDVSLDVYPKGEGDAEPIETRDESYTTLEDALEGFTIDGKPLCECGGEPKPPVTPA